MSFDGQTRSARSKAHDDVYLSDGRLHPNVANYEELHVAFGVFNNVLVLEPSKTIATKRESLETNAFSAWHCRHASQFASRMALSVLRPQMNALVLRFETGRVLLRFVHILDRLLRRALHRQR